MGWDGMGDIEGAERERERERERCSEEKGLA